MKEDHSRHASWVESKLCIGTPAMNVDHCLDLQHEATSPEAGRVDPKSICSPQVPLAVRAGFRASRGFSEL